MDLIYAATTDSGSLPGAVLGFMILFYLAILGVALWVYARIVAKSGYPWPWIFIMFVPFANIVFFCLFAFRPWPIEQELAATRQALLAATGSPYPGPQFGGGQFGGGQFGGGSQYGGGQLGGGQYDGGQFGGQPGGPVGGQFGVQPAFDHGGYEPGREQGYQPGYDQGGFSKPAASDNPYGPKY